MPDGIDPATTPRIHLECLVDHRVDLGLAPVRSWADTSANRTPGSMKLAPRGCTRSVILLPYQIDLETETNEVVDLAAARQLMRSRTRTGACKR
jgi:hypothetical protein